MVVINAKLGAAVPYDCNVQKPMQHSLKADPTNSRDVEDGVRQQALRCPYRTDDKECCTGSLALDTAEYLEETRYGTCLGGRKLSTLRSRMPPSTVHLIQHVDFHSRQHALGVQRAPLRRKNNSLQQSLCLATYVSSGNTLRGPLIYGLGTSRCLHQP